VEVVREAIGSSVKISTTPVQMVEMCELDLLPMSFRDKEDMRVAVNYWRRNRRFEVMEAARLGR